MTDFIVTESNEAVHRVDKVGNGWKKRQAERNKQSNQPFIAWDGEGYTDSAGVHHYYLFGASTGEFITGELDYQQCFDLLLTVADNHRGIHVIFAGTYDMTMMIHTLPAVTVQRIAKGYPTHIGNDYRVEWFKGKYLKLSDRHGRRVVLYDVFSFFSTSFVNACREYLGDNPDFDRIASVKVQRDSFTLESLDTLVIPYWKQELRYLVELMEILRERFKGADIPLRQWHGPGAVASAVFRAKGINAHRAAQPPEVTEAARHAYYGGRFELFQIGTYLGDVYQYDIRSAYPAAISLLPSLTDTEWNHYSFNEPKRWKLPRGNVDSFALYRVSVLPGTDSMNSMVAPGGAPWRDSDGAIYFPQRFVKSWLWGVEVLALIQACERWQYGTVRFHEAWIPTKRSTNRPFKWVEDMYYQRAEMKKAGNPTQLALKLSLNSLYGKMAQSKGARKRGGEWQLPAYHQLEWAGWVTAFTRAKIMRAINMVSSMSSLIAVETDAIYTTEPLKLDVGPKLGQWEEEVSSGIMYIQSGVYFKRKLDGSWQLKSRGFEPRGHTFEHWQEGLKDLPFINPRRTMKHTVRRFGADPRRTERYGKWYEESREYAINAGGKRLHFKPDSTMGMAHCEGCRLGLSFAEHLHQLVVPTTRFPSQSVPSTPHQLPWQNEGAYEYEDEWIVNEEGMEEIEWV